MKYISNKTSSIIVGNYIFSISLLYSIHHSWCCILFKNNLTNNFQFFIGRGHPCSIVFDYQKFLYVSDKFPLIIFE